MNAIRRKNSVEDTGQVVRQCMEPTSWVGNDMKMINELMENGDIQSAGQNRSSNLVIQSLAVLVAALMIPLLLPYLPESVREAIERIRPPKFVLTGFVALWAITSVSVFIFDSKKRGCGSLLSIWPGRQSKTATELLQEQGLKAIEETNPDITNLITNDLGRNMALKGAIITKLPAGKWVHENQKDWKIVERSKRRFDMFFDFSKLNNSKNMGPPKIPCLAGMDMDLDEYGELLRDPKYLESKRQQWIKHFNRNLDRVLGEEGTRSKVSFFSISQFYCRYGMPMFCITLFSVLSSILLAAILYIKCGGEDITKLLQSYGERFSAALSNNNLSQYLKW